ncbi:D-amino acid dehydrogenase [Thioflexithrix psekupsensis]|uniref:FAD dependent oxidoreductase domain-containing protein n=1 Tax=Thioflexithrix psekupsensis TaxID=1570016 RepID=A0A251X7Y5_9GAMM|nr:D-amino acid dehydrogenase [Thioflexithrix psekupsensis]OUD14045.1 hypothetical protein TPSD3_06815 [Thioflexithrix psekupsensis]
MKIIILGAGVVGITTAYYLNRAGHDVTVIEQKEGAGLMTSFANGGQLSYSYTDPVAQPYLLAQLPELMLRYYAPLAIRFSLSPEFLRWVWLFLKNCRASRVPENTLKTLKLAFYSREQLHQLLAECPELSFHYQQNGKMYLYFDEKEMQRGQKRCAFKNQWGCQQEVFSASECLAKEPQLKHVKSTLVGGVFSPLDECGNAYLFTQQLAHYCQQQGVAFLYNTTVKKLHAVDDWISEVHTSRGIYSAEAFVLAAAIQSPVLSKPLGVYLPVYPMKGYSLSIPITAQSPHTCLTDSQHRTVYSYLGDILRVAGMAEVGSEDLDLTPKKLAMMLELAQQTFPDGGHYENSQFWAGVRPMTPDSAPILGVSPYRNLYFNIGHGMLGWTLACGSAAVLTDIVSQKTPQIAVEGFRWDRF